MTRRDTPFLLDELAALHSEEAPRALMAELAALSRRLSAVEQELFARAGRPCACSQVRQRAMPEMADGEEALSEWEEPEPSGELEAAGGPDKADEAGLDEAELDEALEAERDPEALDGEEESENPSEEAIDETESPFPDTE